MSQVIVALKRAEEYIVASDISEATKEYEDALAASSLRWKSIFEGHELALQNLKLKMFQEKEELYNTFQEKRKAIYSKNREIP